MVVELSQRELTQVRRAVQDRIEVLRHFTGKSIEEDLEELLLIREKLK
jgi:hypothetical protein